MTSTTTGYRTTAPVRDTSNGLRTARSFTETKAFYKTSEFMVWLASVAAILAVTYLVDGTDGLRTWHGWLLVTILSSAYMFAHGIAKAGTREPYSYDSDNR